MFEVRDLPPKALGDYRHILDEALLADIQAMASCVAGARIAHVNATAAGGGVAEILVSMVPLYRDLGLDTSWLVMDGDDAFFDVTKRLHNALQGAPAPLTASDWDTFMSTNRKNAEDLLSGYDVVFVHDPQPAALRLFTQGKSQQWVWRSHIDTSMPNPDAWEMILRHAQEYDAAIFSLGDFVGAGLSQPKLVIAPPAIDPFTPKNRSIAIEAAQRVVGNHGVDLERPFICQVSRFDPWKDPLGVIECFRLLKRDHPDLQLVLLGNFADDDPEGRVMFGKVLKASKGIDDLHIVTGLSDMVGPFQSLSQVVLQKSLREGFGLTVTEALWKGTPVVGGAVGGIRLQILDGVGGFLVKDVSECANRVDYLLTHEKERAALGKAGREHVRKHFLLPRLLRDELRLLCQLLTEGRAASAVETVPAPAPPVG